MPVQPQLHSSTLLQLTGHRQYKSLKYLLPFGKRIIPWRFEISMLASSRIIWCSLDENKLYTQTAEMGNFYFKIQDNHYSFLSSGKHLPMITEFPVEFVLSNGTHVLVKKINESAFEFHLTRLNSMKHNFNWTDSEGITDAETATALPRESFSHEESEAITIFQQLRK